MILYLALGVSALAAGLLVYRYDLYEREPWYMLVLAAGCGAAAMRAAGFAEAAAFGLSAAPSNAFLSAVAAACEELARVSVVVAIAVVFPDQFDDPMDGIIYGSIAGVGMAVEESLSLLPAGASSILMLPPEELVRLGAHLVLGGIGGFAIGMARMRKPRWPAALAGCLAVAIGLHFLWDWIRLGVPPDGETWRSLAGAAVMLAGMVFYGYLVVVGSAWSREVFPEAAPRRLWGWPFTSFGARGKERPR